MADPNVPTLRPENYIEQIKIWYIRLHRMGKISVSLFSLAGILAACSFFYSQFTQARPPMGLAYSRLMLVCLGFLVFLGLWIVVRQFWKGRWPAIVSTVISVGAMLALDRLAPKPHPRVESNETGINDGHREPPTAEEIARALAKRQFEPSLHAPTLSHSSVESSAQVKTQQFKTPQDQPSEPTSHSEQVNVPAAIISVQDSNAIPVSGAQVLFVSTNGTHSRIGFTDTLGLVHVLKPISLSVDVYCAHKDFAAYYKSNYDPAEPLHISLGAEPNVGSLISVGVGAVHLPGLDGSWDPRTYPSSYLNAGEHYAYAYNLSVNGQTEALFPFMVGQDLLLEDSQGHRIDLRLVAARAESFLMQYRRR